MRVGLRSRAGRARRLKTRSRPRGSMKAGRKKLEGKPSMNREMCASLRPKGPVRKVPTSYDCSAESPGFNGGQHTCGGLAQLSHGRPLVHPNIADKAPPLPVIPLGDGRGSSNGVEQPGSLPAGSTGSDSGKVPTSSRVMRRCSVHHHHQLAQLPHSLRPSIPLARERRLDGTCSSRPARRRTYAPFAEGRAATTGCTATSSSNFAPDIKIVSARTRAGQRRDEKSICDLQLDIEQPAWSVSLRSNPPCHVVYEVN